MQAGRWNTIWCVVEPGNSPGVAGRNSRISRRNKLVRQMMRYRNSRGGGEGSSCLEGDDVRRNLAKHRNEALQVISVVRVPPSCGAKVSTCRIPRENPNHRHPLG